MQTSEVSRQSPEEVDEESRAESRRIGVDDRLAGDRADVTDGATDDRMADVTDGPADVEVASKDALDSATPAVVVDLEGEADDLRSRWGGRGGRAGGGRDATGRGRDVGV